MKFSYFPGCTLKNKAKILDIYARKCAEKLGFEICKRKTDYREVNGKKYDGLYEQGFGQYVTADNADEFISLLESQI